MLLAKTNPDKTLISDKEASYIISMLFENNDYGISIQAMDHNIAGNLIEMINDYRFNKNDTFKGLTMYFSHLTKKFLSSDRKSVV